MKAYTILSVLFMILLNNIPVMAQTKINIEVNGHKLTATLEDNSSANALVRLLEEAPVSVDANEYGGFEMVGSLPATLPRNDRQITTKPGDIILYLGNNICFYYGVNLWNFTRLGTIDNAGSLDLKSIFGASDGSARFVLSAAVSSSVESIGLSESPEIIAIHSVNGEAMPHTDPARLAKGVYLITERFPSGRTMTRKIMIS